MSSKRAELEAALTEASRDMAGWTLMVHQAITSRFGLGPTDMKCLDLARGEPDLTAGRLAEITGLSTSAVTSAIDRLEKRGFVERTRDPGDRRKVIIRTTGTHDTEAGKIFADIETRYSKVLADYSVAELELINGYIRRLNKESQKLVPRLSARP